MLKITSKVEGEKASISLEGKLDTNSAHDFNDEVMPISHLPDFEFFL